MTPLHALGEELRRAREGRGIALGAIAETTKISRVLLQALERGDCSRWPGGLYDRSYVRDYARAVGLPPEETVRRFMACRSGAAQPAAEGDEATRAIRPAPLRLTLAGDPAELWATRLLRARLVVLDAAIAFGAAAAVASATDVDLWVAAALASLGCHAMGVLRTGTSAASGLAASIQGAAGRDTSDPAEESVAAGSASMQLS